MNIQGSVQKSSDRGSRTSVKRDNEKAHQSDKFTPKVIQGFIRRGKLQFSPKPLVTNYVFQHSSTKSQCLLLQLKYSVGPPSPKSMLFVLTRGTCFIIFAKLEKSATLIKAVKCFCLSRDKGVAADFRYIRLKGCRPLVLHLCHL